jgi:hypothetical protein
LRHLRPFLRPLLLAAALGWVLPGPLARATPPGHDPGRPDRVVFLAGGLSDEERITVPAAFAASGHPGVLLLDTPASRAPTRSFLQAFRPSRLVLVGSFPGGTADLERALGVKADRIVPSATAFPTCWQRALFPRAPRVVVAPAAPRRLLLQAACLAGAARAPLLVSHDQAGDAVQLRHAVAYWNSREVLAVGPAYRLCRDLGDVAVVRLADEAAVATACLRHLRQRGPIETLVVTNPADDRAGLGGTSSLAPWLAAGKRAALLLTNDQGTDVEAVVRAALRHEALARVDSVVLAGSPGAIPTGHRPNPVPGGKDESIEMEPLTPVGPEPVSFAVGRLFHPDPGVVALLLARERLLPAGGAGRALVVSNPGNGLPLLETVSRSTAQELQNAGYRTTALFGDEASVGKVRRLLPEQDLFLWEGHHSTLARQYGVHRWPEPLRPSLFFMQSCLALSEEESLPLLERGAVGVIGSSTRTYSGSGSAIALAFFDALLYERQSVGGALRHAKNFLLAFSRLKEKRLGEAPLSGASVRSAWAFTLWGDPTLKLPAPPPPPGALERVRHRVEGRTLIVSLPGCKHEKVEAAGYQAQASANVRLAGLCARDKDDGQHLVPLVFVEARLPGVPPGATPRLHSRLRDDSWVFLWDGRRRCGYLLVRPRAGASGELRFHITW